MFNHFCNSCQENIIIITITTTLLSLWIYTNRHTPKWNFIACISGEMAAFPAPPPPQPDRGRGSHLELQVDWLRAPKDRGPPGRCPIPCQHGGLQHPGGERGLPRGKGRIAPSPRSGQTGPSSTVEAVRMSWFSAAPMELGLGRWTWAGSGSQLAFSSSWGTPEFPRKWLTDIWWEPLPHI